MVAKKLTKEAKQKLFKQFSGKKSEHDTGSSSSQIVLFTYRIKYLTEYLKIHKKDNASTLGLIKLLGKRKRLLTYLQKTDSSQYKLTIAGLGLRK